MKVRNISPLGAVEVLGRLVAAGDTFEVSDEDAARLLAQPDNFEAVPADPTKEATK